MEGQVIKVFEWVDIQIEICKEMGIDEEYFMKYHKLIGGSYKNLWHEWTNYFDEATMGIITRNDLGENMESKMEWVREDGKDWLEPFVKAVYKVWDDYEIEYVQY